MTKIRVYDQSVVKMNTMHEFCTNMQKRVGPDFRVDGISILPESENKLMWNLVWDKKKGIPDTFVLVLFSYELE